jgi:hypothetical protein
MAGTFTFSQGDPDLLNDDERRRLAMQAYRSRPLSKQRQIIETMCKDMPHRFIRDFAVIDTSRKPQFQGESIIYHLKSGLWRAYPCSFEHAAAELEANPDRDHELIVTFHEP